MERTQSRSPVVLINDTFARKYCPNENPLGQRVQIGRSEEVPAREIVGVVGTAKHGSLAVRRCRNRVSTPDCWERSPRRVYSRRCSLESARLTCSPTARLFSSSHSLRSSPVCYRRGGQCASIR